MGDGPVEILPVDVDLPEVHVGLHVLGIHLDETLVAGDGFLPLPLLPVGLGQVKIAASYSGSISRAARQSATAARPAELEKDAGPDLAGLHDPGILVR